MVLDARLPPDTSIATKDKGLDVGDRLLLLE
jgi:hypothetical protein